MVRAPRAITPVTWQPGGENYIFLSIGSANSPGTFQFEVKTTVNSISTLIIENTTSGQAIIQVARIGPYFIALKRDANGWSVHHRYRRTDMPSILQVGMTTYTDYNTASMVSPLEQNSTVIHGGRPDLIAAFDYFRFERPRVPIDLMNANLSDASVSDAQLLAFLGANAGNSPPAPRRRSAKH
jgi:hypothetical protein